MKYPRQSPTTPARARKTKRDRALESIYHEKEGDRDLKTMEQRGGGNRGLTLLLLLVLLGMGIGAYANSKPGLLLRKQKNEATLTVQAQKEAALFTPYTLKLSIDPGVAAVKEGSVSVFLPNGFVLRETTPAASQSPSKKEKQWTLNAQNPKQTITLSGIFLGNLSEQQTFRSVLTYKPANFDSEFQTNVLHTVLLKETPVALTIDAPEQAYGGEEKTYVLTIKNTSRETLHDLTIVPPSVSGFALTDPDTDALLAIKEMAPDAAVVRTLHGSFGADATGVIASAWTITTTFEDAKYTVASVQKTVAVQEQPILVTIALKDALTVLRPGDMLAGEVRYQNKTAEPLKNVTVKLTIQAPAKKRDSLLDWTRLDTTGSPKVEGVQLSDTMRSGIITWSPDLIPTQKTVPPGATGVLSFSLPIKSSSAFDVTALGAADLILTVDVTAGEQTVSAQPIAIPLVADTAVQAGAVKAGDTIVMQWTVTHHFHTVKDTKITAHLFGATSWLDQSDTSDGDIVYDSVNQTVTWNLGTLTPTDGVSTASFAVRVNKSDPTQTTLLDETTLTATDETAGRPISRTVAAVKLPR